MSYASLGRRIQQILGLSQERPLPLSFRLHTLVVVSVWAVVLLCLSHVFAVAAPSGDRGEGSADLKSVRELDRRVSYTETKIPLGELVQQLAAETGAPLSASSIVADEPVAVVVKEFPARELLEQLADLLGYRWSRSR